MTENAIDKMVKWLEIWLEEENDIVCGPCVDSVVKKAKDLQAEEREQERGLSAAIWQEVETMPDGQMKKRFIQILSNYPAQKSESLAELADRKGWYIEFWGKSDEGHWELQIYKHGYGDGHVLYGDRPTECEQEAKVFLRSLPDKPAQGEGRP